MDKYYDIRVGFETGRGLFSFYSAEKRDEAFEIIYKAMQNKGIARFHNEEDNSEVLLDCAKVLMVFTFEEDSKNKNDEEDEEGDINMSGASIFSVSSDDIVSFFKKGGNNE